MDNTDSQPGDRVSNRTNQLNRYTVTYAFNDYLHGEYAEAIFRIHQTIAEFHREDVEITFLGATVEIDGAAQLVTTTVRYEAPTKGTIGQLNCRAGLPACGQPQRVDTATTQPDRSSHGQSAQELNS